MLPLLQRSDLVGVCCQRVLDDAGVKSSGDFSAAASADPSRLPALLQEAKEISDKRQMMK